jgi:hypothetical protein
MRTTGIGAKATSSTTPTMVGSPPMQRTRGRSVAALGEQNIGKLYRQIRKSADDSLLQLLPSFTQFN